MIEGLFVAFAVGLGTFVQTIAGFGSALVAMPLITQLLGIHTAAPMQALVGLLSTTAILYRNRRGFRWRESILLIAGGVMGIPLGVLALRTLPSEPIVACLGLMMLAYAAFQYWIQPRLQSTSDSDDADSRVGLLSSRNQPSGSNECEHNGSSGSAGASSSDENSRSAAGILAWLVGFVSGILGGAYATDGPPLVVYGAVKRWPKETFRALLQACFLVNGFVVVGCHAVAGLITINVLQFCCFAVPGMLAGLLLGAHLDRRIDHARFRKLLLALIVILGVTLLARALQS